MTMNQQYDPDHLARRLILETGLEFSGKRGRDGGNHFLEFHTIHPPSPNGFAIRLIFHWKRIEMIFIPDNYSRDIIRSLGRTEEGIVIFRALIRKIIESSGKIELKVNNIPFNPEHLIFAQEPWGSFGLKIYFFTDDSISSDYQKSEIYIFDRICEFTELLISLLPFEEQDDVRITACYQEGEVIHQLVKKYERSRLNRTACIAIHGCQCRICGFDFSEKYGPLGDGFIHVHHITPVSEITPGYRVNPESDLIPVCPNCHAMLHRTDPPLSPDQLIKKICDSDSKEQR